MKRPISFIVGLSVCGALLAGCGGAGPTASSGQAGPAQQPAGVNAGQDGQLPPPGGLPNFTRAPELPAGDPSAAGIFVSRNGDTITLRGGMGDMRPQGTPPAIAPDGTPPAFDANAGTAIDVVIGENTKLYRDVTQFDPAGMQSGQALQQQVQTADSLDALGVGEGGLVQVWGETSGGKLMASVIVYSQLPARPVLP